MSTLRVNNMTNVGGTGSTYAAGHVVQVVTAAFDSITTTTSTSFVNTNVSAIITPKSASSKILVIVNFTIDVVGTTQQAFATIFRGDVSGTNLGNGNSGLSDFYSGSQIRVATSNSILDSPNTTNSQTYTLAIRRNAGSSIVVNPAGERATITLMEVAA